MNFNTKTNNISWLIRQLEFVLQSNPKTKDWWTSLDQSAKKAVERDWADTLRYNL